MCACESKNSKEVLDEEELDFGTHTFKVTAEKEEECKLCHNDSYSILIEVLDKDCKIVTTRNRANFCTNIECNNSYITKAKKYNEPLPGVIIETIEEEINKEESNKKNTKYKAD